jgi:hypothetical protein
MYPCEKLPCDGGTQPGVGQRGVDVLHGGEDAVGVPAGDLVAHGDVLEVDPGTLLCTHVAAALGSEASEERSELGTSMITPMLLPLKAFSALVSGK